MSINIVEDVEITIWCKYHRPGGFIKSLCISPDDNLVIVREQLGKGAPEIDEEAEYTEEERQDLDFSRVLELISEIEFKPLVSYEYNRMGGSFFGLRIEYGFQKVSFEWHGAIETTDKAISGLYEYVHEL